jgi:signal transduction histidine kinase
MPPNSDGRRCSRLREAAGVKTPSPLMLLGLNLLLTGAAAKLCWRTPELNAAHLSVWLVGSLVLESAAFELPQFGRFQLVAVWSLAILAKQDAPPLEAALAIGSYFLARTLWTLAAPKKVNAKDESLAVQLDWLSNQSWLLSFGLQQFIFGPSSSTKVNWIVWLVAGGLSLASHRILTTNLAGPAMGDFGSWRKLELLLSPLKTLALTGAAGMLALPSEWWWIRVSFLPVLIGYMLGTYNLIEVARSQQEQLQRIELEERLRNALASKQLANQQLKVSSQARELQQQLTTRLSSATNLSEAGSLLANLLGPQLGLRSFGFYFCGSGQSIDLETLFVSSPQKALLENLRLVDGEQKSVQQALRDQRATVASPAVLDSERDALFVPLGPTLFYLGREAGPSRSGWSSEELTWLAWVLQQGQPILVNLSVRTHQQQQIQQVQAEKSNLEMSLRGQACLLECSRRFASHLNPDCLWQEMADFLDDLLPLQGCALLNPQGQCQVQHGTPWSESALSSLVGHLKKTRTLLYLANQDRARWPVLQQEAETLNVLAFPLTVGGCLVLSFRGQTPLNHQEIELLEGVCNLFGTAFARALLHQDVVSTYRRLERSQELWLQTHKSLAIAQMSAGVAHELNSPLGAARLAIESAILQARTPELATLRDRLNGALSSCGAAQAIIEQLSQLGAQHSSGQGSCDLVQVLRLVLEQLSPKFTQAKVQLQVQAPASLVYSLDRSAVEQLLLPLLINALEAVEAPEIVNRCVRVVLSQKEQWIELEVHDSGFGIPAELQSRVCEAFFTTKVIGKNLGLGLANVQQLCRQQGLELRISSEPKQGCQMVIRCPLKLE